MLHCLGWRPATRYAAATGFDGLRIIVQVESVHAIAELDGFIDVHEVDCFFIGAVELAKSIGHAGDYSHPEVEAELLRTIGASGTRAGRSDSWSRSTTSASDLKRQNYAAHARQRLHPDGRQPGHALARRAPDSQ
ncbi:MAG: aldolase/citrate lyase family protein [Betaproteobacteria bacterium]